MASFLLVDMHQGGEETDPVFIAQPTLCSRASLAFVLPQLLPKHIIPWPYLSPPFTSAFTNTS
jgi:hypothetical protein